MTTLHLILLDQAVALLSVVAWFTAGAAVALRHLRLGAWLMAAAVAVVIVRVVTVAVLSGHGWWFVEEKVLLGLPLACSTALTAVLLAGPELLRARRHAGTALSAASVVVLLTAGYAALGGLAVTFLAGYPLSWSASLITVALVGAAALVTAQVVTRDSEVLGRATSPGRARGVRPTISRRSLLTVAGGAAVVTVGGAGAGLALPQGPAVVRGGGPGPKAHRAVSVTQLRGATTPAAGGVVRRFVLAARTATVQLASGADLDALTYDGQVPGPAIVANEGDLLEVTLRNKDIDHGVTLHWHGYDVACGEDGAPGVTQRAVWPGDEFVHRFRADQVGTYWYHTHQASHEGVRRGLYGTLVVHPRDVRTGSADSARTVDLTLPLHTFGGAVVIGNGDGRSELPMSPGTPVRLRLVNTDSDPHRLVLVGSGFKVASVDGRDLHQPDEVRDVGLRLPAGGRYDLVFTMPHTPVTLLIDNNHRAGGLRLRPDGASVGSTPEVTGTSGWPELDLLHYGQPLTPPFDLEDAARHFTIVLDRGLAMVDGKPAFAQTVNGKGHPSIPDQLVAEGDLVRFTVVNRSLETHPWHLHGHAVLVLSRDGTRSSGSPLWLDTFDVRPGEVWEVAFRATNPGVWMNHCHNLPHAREGMMLRLVYDGVTALDTPGLHSH